MSESPRSSSRRRPLFVVASTLLVCFAVSPALAQSKPRVIASQAAPERTHRLFVGVDVFVPQENEMMRVKNITGRTSLLAAEDGHLTEIERTTGFRFKLVPKVSGTAAVLDDIEWETTFSPRKDPNRAWASRQTNIMNYQQDQMDQAEYMMTGIAQATRAPAPGEQDSSPMDRLEAANNQRLTTQISSIMDQSEMIDAITNPEFARTERSHLVEITGHDAMTLSFMVSTPEKLSNAYIIALARLRSPDGAMTDINFYKHIGEVGPKPRKVTHLQTGLPENAEILEVKVHVFNNGKELATNLSEKRFELTTEEAMQYLMLDHTANHRGQSIDAQPVWELAPPELKAAESARAVDFPVIVKIDADGHLVGIDGGNLIIPDPIVKTIKGLTFLPALQEGTPIASTTTVNLADYFR